MSLANMAERIRDKRRERGYTQEKLARLLDLTPAAISKWETGQAFPDISTLCPLAAAFGISVDELLGYDPEVSEEKAQELVAPAREKAFRGDAEGAAEACEAVMKDHPMSITVAFSCASVLMEAAQSTNNESLAHEMLERSVGLFERCMLEGSSDQREAAAFVLAGQYVLMGDCAKAIEAARSIHRAQADPRIMEAAALAASGSLVEAETVAREALREKEEDAALLKVILENVEKGASDDDVR